MSSQRAKKTPKRSKRARVDSDQLERLDSLPWSSSLAETDDPFSLVTGSNELEGGFLSLEEIDESEYGLGIPNSGNENRKGKQEKVKLKKRKHKEGSDSGGSDGEDEDESQENAETVEEGKKEVKKKKKKKKNKKKKSKKPEETADTVAEDTEDNNGVEEDPVDEAEYYSWKELRLHPLLLNSICRLKFKEPTPIQKACIPAAAHQGKDVVGAAETGSGKTLAFGLPILQRLLEEQEKFDNLVEMNGDVDEKIASKGLLRALIITPTRELALQLDAVAPNNLPPPNPMGPIAVANPARDLVAERNEEAARDRNYVARRRPRYEARRVTPNVTRDNDQTIESMIYNTAASFPYRDVKYPDYSTFTPSASLMLCMVHYMDYTMFATKRWTDNCMDWVSPYSMIYFSTLF